MESNKTNREAALLVMVVFVLGIVLGGLAVHVWGDRIWAQQPTNGNRSRDQVVADFTRELSLTAVQQQQLAAVVDDTRSRWRALYTPLDDQHEQIRQQGREKIRAILTPEQRPKFEDFLRRLDEQRKKDQAIH
jgi:Spy/CpxP family protein refolding chaperone